MINEEIVKLSSPVHSWAGPSSEPNVPPGFASIVSTAAAESSRNQNPTFRGGGFRRGRGRTPYSFGQQSTRRRTSRKRSQTQFYEPPPASQPAVPRRRRGRPPKARVITQLSGHQELEPRNTSAHSLTSRQEHISSFIKSLHITNEQQPSSQPNDIHSRNIQETLIDISLTEAPSREVNDQISQNILDPKILQHVANDLHYMPEAQTEMPSDINNDLADTLKAINKKHGDITKDCSLESGCMRTLVLLGICKVVQDLQKKQFKDVDSCMLDSYYTAVRDAEKMKVNVRWLRDRLDEINDAVKISEEAKGLVNEKNRCIENIDTKKKELLLFKDELERVKCEIRNIEQELAQKVVVVEELNMKISARISKSPQLELIHLMDGLI